MAELDCNENVVIILIQASNRIRLDKATRVFLEGYPDAAVQPPLSNTRAPHKNGVRRYINVVVNGEEDSP